MKTNETTQVVIDSESRQKRERRYFSEEFRKLRVLEWDEGKISVSEISRLYEVSPAAVYKWLVKYSLRYTKQIVKVIELESESHKRKELEKQVLELQRLLGQKVADIEWYKALLEEVSEKYGIEIKKK